MENIVKIARGIIVNDEKILLCHNLTGGHYFLPGGHVEVGETPEETLKREMVEETGLEVTKIKFLLDFPNIFLKNGANIKEVATIFLAKIASKEVVSKEDWIAFEWVPVESLTVINFKPTESGPDILKSIEDNKPFWL